MWRQCLAIVGLLAAAVNAAIIASRHQIYSGYKVYRVEPRDSSEAAALYELSNNLDLDEWQTPAVARPGLLMASPAQQALLVEALKELDVAYSLHTEDVAELLGREDEQLKAWRSRRTRNIPFEDFPRHSEINAYLQQLATSYPDRATLELAGLSTEGREIYAMRVSTTNFTDTSKPIVMLGAMLHAREWATTPTVLYVLHRLLEAPESSDLELLRDLDWIVMPLLNPDGYEYTHTDERLWRRTRSVNLNVSTTCFGVDANRNFDVQFNTVGVSPDPCSQTYPGVEAFSEPETRANRDVVLQYADRIALYIDVHSHGSWVLFGWGNGTLTRNSAVLHAAGAAMGAAIDAVKLPEAPFYLVGNSALLLYATSGSAQDWAQTLVPLSYTLELPGLGNGFQLAPELMHQVNYETWQGTTAAARIALASYKANN